MTKRGVPRDRNAQAEYGQAHRELRAQWTPIVALGKVNCSRCGKPIPGGNPNDRAWRKSWHLDHDDDRQHYRGPSHALCNVIAPHQKRTPARRLPNVTVTEW